jgi:stearoyl-CoA desaturase (delta-9 desaturase)
LAVLASVAIEGPVSPWVADHRAHHACSDRRTIRTATQVDHGVGWRGALRGLVHAHVGWLFRLDQRGSRARYGPGLLADSVIRFVDAAWRAHRDAVAGRKRTGQPGPDPVNER